MLNINLWPNKKKEKTRKKKLAFKKKPREKVSFMTLIRPEKEITRSDYIDHTYFLKKKKILFFNIKKDGSSKK